MMNMDCIITQHTDSWEWQTTNKILDDCLDSVPDCLWSDGNMSKDIPFMYGDPVTPSQGSGEGSTLADESEDVEIVDDIPKEPGSSPRYKRRKLLHFKSDVSRFEATPGVMVPCPGLMVPSPSPGVGSQEVAYTVEAYPDEEELSEQPDPSLQCPDGALTAGTESLDKTSEAWVSSLIDDRENVLICTDENLTPVQTVDEDDEYVEIVDEVPAFSNKKIVDGVPAFSSKKIVNAVPAWSNVKIIPVVPTAPIKRASVRNATKQAVPSSSGRKQALRTSRLPPKGKNPIVNPIVKPSSRSFIAYPFAFIKPNALAGEVTLKDINRKLCPTPSAPNNNHQDDDQTLYPTSAFSGKPVVGATTIRTEGGKGAITILRTKG